MNKIKQNKGFTLVELLMVVFIIGVLSALAIPQYEKAIARARYAEIQTLTEQLNDAEEMYFMEHGYYTNNFNQLKDFRVPGWTIKNSERIPGAILRKDDGKAQLDLRTILTGDRGRAIIGTLFKKKGGAWTNSYVIYSPHGGWREGVRECRSNVTGDYAEYMYDPTFINNHVCDSVGAVRCTGNSSNGNIFVIESVAAIHDGSKVGDIVTRICKGKEGNGYNPEGYDQYYKGKRLFQSYVAD